MFFKKVFLLLNICNVCFGQETKPSIVDLKKYVTDKINMLNYVFKVNGKETGKCNTAFKDNESFYE